MKHFHILFLILLVGCAAPTTKQVKINPVLAEIEAKKQRELVLQETVVANKRLSKISYRILTGAVSLCPKKSTSDWGFTFGTSTRGKTNGRTLPSVFLE